MNATGNSEAEYQLQRIPLAAITVDPEIQQRAAGTSQDIVADYAEAMRDGVAFPPVDVFGTGDGILYLANGFHRRDAQQSACPDVKDIECRVHPGNRDDALLFACGANAQHGLRRSRSDKVKAVTTLLRSERWRGWSDREIARQRRVSHRFVATVRRDYLEKFPDAGPPEDAASASADPSATDAPGIAPDRGRTVRRGGRRYRMKTARIGRGRSTPGRRKKVAPKPKLNSLAWSEANTAERVRFIEAVGRVALEDALDASQPLSEVARVERAYDRFKTVLRAACEPARKSFIEHRCAEIMGLARSIDGCFAAASSPPSTDSRADGGHDGDR
jgi:ParB-like nuclease domain